jgi:hypothetical protein
MPTSVVKLFSSVLLSVSGPVRWGSPIPSTYPGGYVVAVTSDPEDDKNVYGNKPPIDLDKLQAWINRVPNLRVDNVRPIPDMLEERLRRFWLPDEPVLYVGKAGISLRNRVNQYYKTPLGDRRPHAGGHWLKTLSILNNLSVFWATTPNPQSSENELLETFTRAVSENTLLMLRDPARPFPFANLEFPKGNRKNHGITGAVNRQ